MIRTVRRVQLIAPASVAVLLGMAVAVTVAAIANPKPTNQPETRGCVPVTGGVPDAAQERNARIIIGIGLARELGSTGAAIGVSVGLAESTLFNYANDGTSTLVGSAEGRQLNDSERAAARESLGIRMIGREQPGLDRLVSAAVDDRVGHPAELIDPATSAGKFFDRLVQVPGWQGMPPWNAAQTVQGSSSSDGGIYRDMYQEAIGIVTELTGNGTGTTGIVVGGGPGSGVRITVGGPGRRNEQRRVGGVGWV